METTLSKLQIRDGDNPLRILVVGKDPVFLGYYRELLLEIGMLPFLANSYEGGLSRLQSGTFDFVVVDQGSLMFEGRCILEFLRGADKRTSALVITRRLDFSCRLAAMRLGAVNYLEGPLALPQLVRVISKSLGLSSGGYRVGEFAWDQPI